MKKFIYTALFLPLLFGCTLSMEEYIVPEEQLGFDEPRTIESENGYVTYQFNDGVIYVSDNVQEYLEQVDHDSILYFNTTLPREWRPQVGSKLASGCTHKLPFGLNHRVLSVEDVGGFLKVVCTKTSIDDVYKYLEYSIDAGISTIDQADYDDETLKKMGLERHDSVLINWNAYDATVTRAQAGTRADEEDGKPTETDMKEAEGSDSSKPEETEWIDWFFDTRDISSLKKAKHLEAWNIDEIAGDLNKTGGEGSLYAGVGLKVTEFKKAHTARKPKEEYEENWVDEWFEWEVKVEGGYEYKVSTVRARDSYGTLTMREYMQGAKQWTAFRYNGQTWKPNFSVKAPQNSGWAHAQMVFPIGMLGPVSVSFMVGGTVDPILDIGGSIAVSGSFTTATHRTGYKTGKGGKKQDIDEDIAPGHFNWKSINLDGHFNVGVKGRAYAGFLFGGTVGVTIGANAEAAAKAECTLVGYDFAKSDVITPKGTAQAYVKSYGDIQLHVQPLGIHMWDKQLFKFWEKDWLKVTTEVEPTLWSGLSAMTDEGEFTCTAHWEIYKNGFMWKLLAAGLNLRPGMLLYFGPISEGHYVVMEEDSEGYWGTPATPPFTSLDEGKTYNFKMEGNYSEDVKKFYIRPCLLDENNEPYAMCAPDHCESAEVGRGEVLCYDRFQTSGQSTMEYDFSSRALEGGYIDPKSGMHSSTDADPADEDDDPNGWYLSGTYDASKFDWREFKMMAKIELNNGSRISKWGVYVQVYGPDKKTKLIGSHHGKGCKFTISKLGQNYCQSGRYILQFKFLSNWNIVKSTAQEEKLYFSVQPFWYDADTNEQHLTTVYEGNKAEIEYEMTDMSQYYKNKYGTIGTVVKEQSLSSKK